MRKERGELHTLLLLFSLRVRAMACFLWNRLSRCPVLSICGIHGPRHSERHCRYNMMGTGFLVEVQEASLHHIAPSTRGAVESTWATFTPHRLKFLPSVLGARGFRIQFLMEIFSSTAGGYSVHVSHGLSARRGRSRERKYI